MNGYPHVAGLDDPKPDLPEDVWKKIAEDMLILAYVPEASQMTCAEALELAQERDLQASRSLAEDAVELRWEGAVRVAAE